MAKKEITYKDSGVDIDAGNKSVAMIKDAVQATYRPEVVGDLGGFGGLFALDVAKYKQPILVSGTDGVGTKLKIAHLMKDHSTIGQDLVAMCVNDILVNGAEPLFFLDYLAVGKLDPEQVAEIVQGVAKACKLSSCSLIGGEIAEMAGFYKPGEYDVAGFAVGVVDRDKLINGGKIEAGDVVLGLPSSGLHSNGYSLVREICFKVMGFTGQEKFPELQGKTLGEELLTPTRLYPSTILPLLNKFNIKGLAHITGGGLYENIVRVLPDNTKIIIDGDSWSIPPIFTLLQNWGNVPKKEMYRVFNMGIGMVMVLSLEEAKALMADCKERGEIVYEIGKVVAGDKQVEIKGKYLNE